MQHYRHIQRTVTLEDLLEIVGEWTHAGGDLLEVKRDGNGTPTQAMLIDHGQRIRATYSVGLVSDKPAPYISPEKRARQAAIAQAHAIAGQFSVQIDTIHDTEGESSCWAVAIPALQWRPALPFGYCYSC